VSASIGCVYMCMHGFRCWIGCIYVRAWPFSVKQPYIHAQITGTSARP
jgi:hypothetical protein